MKNWHVSTAPANIGSPAMQSKDQAAYEADYPDISEILRVFHANITWKF
ncbi:MAG: hypothetical protein KGI29_07450 [Pseudomonadota bacterium]|nr:hypothetical protein [Pseudomonadota bacterium]MDE3037734.1 hypothetical protein [Pseudomonadota bacterium]